MLFLAQAKGNQAQEHKKNINRYDERSGLPACSWFIPFLNHLDQFTLLNRIGG